jgi:pimeloyl-ACP methyl ester carboxylesterase
MTDAAPRILGAGLAGRIVSGPGTRVLWIHGYTLDSSIWADAWARLSAWSHVGIDLPGHGASDVMTRGTTLIDLARGIGRVARSVQADHLIGLSFGGMVALQVAIECPDAFRSLTVNSPALAGGPQDRHAQVRHGELLRAYRDRGAGPWLRDMWMTSPPEIFTGAAAHPALWQRLREVVGRHPWRELGDGSMEALTSHRQTPATLARIRMPTLVLVGLGDMTAFKRSAEMVRRSIPRCRRVYLPDAGHLGLVETPGAAAPLIEAHMIAASDPLADREAFGRGPESDHGAAAEGPGRSMR